MPLNEDGARVLKAYTGAAPAGSFRSGGRFWDSEGNELVEITDIVSGVGGNEAMLGVDVTAEPHNADPSNSPADNVTAFRSAFAAARLLGTFVFVPPGTYEVNGLIHDAAGTTQPIQMRGIPGESIIARSSNTKIISVLGTRTATGTVSADVAAAASSITFSTDPGLAAGDWIGIRSNLAFAGNAKMAETAKVAAVSGAGPYTVDLEGPLEEAYATANSPVVEKLNLVDDIDIEGITFKQTVVDRGDTNDLVTFFLALAPRIYNCTFIDGDWPGIGITHCIRWYVGNSHFENLIDNLGSNRIGYGVNEHGNCWGGLMENCTGERVRHLYTTNGDSWGAPRYTRYVNAVARDCPSGPHNTHQEGKHITMDNPKAIGCGASIFIRNPHARVINPTVVGGVGSTSQIAWSTSTATDGLLLGGYVRCQSTGWVGVSIGGVRNTVDGVYVEGPAGSSKANFEFVNVNVDGCVLRNVRSKDSNSGGHISVVGGSSGTIIVEGGHFERAAGVCPLLGVGSGIATVYVRGQQTGTNLQRLASGTSASTVVFLDSPLGQVRTVTSAYNMQTNASVQHGLTLADSTTAAFQITLPNATQRNGQIIRLKKIDASANAVTIGTTSSQTIDGVTTKSLAAQYDKITVQSDGVGWHVLA